MQAHKLWRSPRGPTGSSETVYLTASAVAQIALHTGEDEGAYVKGAWSKITMMLGRDWYYPGTPEETVAYLDRSSEAAT